MPLEILFIYCLAFVTSGYVRVLKYFPIFSRARPIPLDAFDLEFVLFEQKLRIFFKLSPGFIYSTLYVGNIGAHFDKYFS